MALNLRNYEPALMEGAQITVTNTNSSFGTAVPGTTNAQVGGVGLEIADSNNTAGGTNLIVANPSSGTSAFVDLFLQNNLADATGTHFAVVNLNSSNYNDTTFGSIFAVANQLQIYGTDGPTAIGTTKAGSFVSIFVGGSSTTNEVQRATASGFSGVGGYLATSTNGIGYATGAGGAVTQLTNRTTGVTLNKLSGTITTNNASLAAEAAAVFTVTNSTVAIGDVVVVSIQSGSNGGNTAITVNTVAAGSFNIQVANNNPAAGTAETGAILINFAVIKAVSA